MCDKLIKNNMLREPESVVDVTINPSYAEYYFDFKTDREIEPKDLCEGLKLLKSQNILLELDVECPDEESSFFDIYSTRVTSIEECD